MKEKIQLRERAERVRVDAEAQGFSKFPLSAFMKRNALYDTHKGSILVRNVLHGKTMDEDVINALEDFVKSISSDEDKSKPE